MQNLITNLDLKALLELSLSIGKSLDLEENCRNFTATLKKHLHQTTCTVWLKNSESDDTFRKAFKNNKSILKSNKLENDHFISQSLQSDQFVSFTSTDLKFIKNKELFFSKKGTFSFIKVSPKIIIALQDVKAETAHSCGLFNQLSPLFQQFSNSIDACLINTQLLNERIQSRKINAELRQFKMMVENISDGIIISDLDNTIIFVNDQLAKLSGYEKQEMLGSKTSDLHLYEDRKNYIEKKIKRSFKGYEDGYEIAHINKKNGKKWWAMVNVSPFKDRHGKIIGGIGVIRDITSQKETELILKENEWKLRNFFEKSPVGIAINDGPNNAIVNERFCEMFGYTKEEFTIYKLENEITLPEEKNSNLDGYKQLVEGKIKSFNFQKRYIKKDGSIMWGNLTLSVLKDEERGTITHFAMVEDVHEEKIMNDTLAFINKIGSLSDSDSLFNDIAKNIGQTFGLPYVLIVEVDHRKNACRSRSFWKDGEFSEFNYDFLNAPCNDTIGRKVIFCIEENVQKKYPKFKALKTLKAESYLASPIFDSNGVVVSQIVMLDTKKMHNVELRKRILKLYSTKLATELEKMKNNQILLDSANKLKEAEKLAKIGSWEYNFETEQIYLSEGIYRIFALKIEDQQLSINKLRNAVHPDDNEKLQDKIEHTILKGKPWEIELRYMINGKIIHSINKGKASFENGQIVKLFGTIQDITDKKETETNLQVAHTKYNDLLENINDAVVILDLDQNIIDCNQAAQTILEYSKEELLKLNIRDCIIPEDLKEAQKYGEKFKKNGFFRDMETRIITKNKTAKYVKVDADTIFENGKRVGSRDIFRDITELKEIEQKRELLYQKVEQANKELKDFAYIVSHDLKAPLRAIGSLTQWLSEDYADKIDKKGQEHLALLNSRVHRMHNFIDGILEYSRLGRVKVAREKVNIHDLVESVIDVLDPKNNKIIIKNTLPTIKCERIRIFQVFQNLISNAIKFNDKKNGKITIDCKELPNAYRFSVEDNGPGIEKKYHDKIFQIFQTLQIRDQFESTGIGLTIVKRIVELHGGTITVKSKIDKGTKFEFTISKN